MNWFTGLVVYLLIWWVTLFAVLPWGARPLDNPAPGHAPSAPADPRIRTKLLATTLVAAVVWLVVVALIQSGAIDFRAMSRDW